MALTIATPKVYQDSDQLDASFNLIVNHVGETTSYIIEILEAHKNACVLAGESTTERIEAFTKLDSILKLIRVFINIAKDEAKQMAKIRKNLKKAMTTFNDKIETPSSFSELYAEVKSRDTDSFDLSALFSEVMDLINIDEIDDNIQARIADAMDSVNVLNDYLNESLTSEEHEHIRSLILDGILVTYISIMQGRGFYTNRKGKIKKRYPKYASHLHIAALCDQLLNDGTVAKLYKIPQDDVLTLLYTG